VKIAAFILALSFAFFYTETLMLPGLHIQTLNSETRVSKCCRKCKMMEQKQSKGAEKGKCNQSCGNCPVFATFYTDHISVSSLIQPVFKSNYVVFSDRFISDYTTDTWKPPDIVKFPNKNKSII